MRSPSPVHYRRGEAVPFQRALRALRRELAWSQGTLASTLGISIRALSTWECGYVLPSHRHRVHLILQLKDVPPEHVIAVANALGVGHDPAVQPLLERFKRALDPAPEPPAPAPPAPAPPPRPPLDPDELRAAMDALVRDAADALDVRASDLRAAFERAIQVCASRGGTVEELLGAVKAKAPPAP